MLALVVADELFPLMSANNDEAVYVFQAEVFRAGHLSLPADSYREVFQPWMSNEHDGRLVLVFQPVFPAVLALSDLLFGSMRVALGLIAAGCVILVALLGRELRFTTRTCVMAAALFALSPFAVFQSALYLEYLFAVLLELAVLTLFLRGRGRAGPVRARLLAAAGLVFGLLVFTRPLEALMLGAALALYLAAAERRIAGAVRNLWWPALGSLPAILGMLLYNAQLTGNPLRFPLWAIGGNNAFGFGKRHVVDTAPIIDATALNALKALHQNLRSLPHWMFGSLLIVPLAFWGLWLRRRDNTTVLLGAIGVLFPLAYVFYWGNLLIVNGRKQIGPHYYMAVMIPTVMFAAVALEWLWRQRPRWIIPLAAVMAVATLVELPDKIDRNQHFTDAYRAEQAAIDATVIRPALVILPASVDGPYLLHPRGWLSNDLALNRDVLYTADRGSRNIDLATRFPERTLYRLQAVEDTTSPAAMTAPARGVRDKDSPVLFSPSVVRVSPTIEESFAGSLMATRLPAGATGLRAYISGGGDRKSCDVPLGNEATVRFLVDSRAAQLPTCATIVSAPMQPDTTVIVGMEFLDRVGAVIEARELQVWAQVRAQKVATMGAETWRILPASTIRARVINDPTLLKFTA